MRPYAVFINEQALAAAPRSAAQREPLMKFVRSLAPTQTRPAQRFPFMNLLVHDLKTALHV
jgi:hypothetical protein